MVVSAERLGRLGIALSTDFSRGLGISFTEVSP